MARILYLSTVFNKPAGGVRTIFHHVRELRRLGFEAAVVSTGAKPAPDWFTPDVPIIPFQSHLVLDPDDVLVLPEGAATATANARPARCRKVLFCQNQFSAFDSLRGAASWAELGVDYALYCSRTVAEAVGRCFTFRDSAVVRCAIDRTLFRPGGKRPSVIFMPRKRGDEVELLRQIFERQWPQYASLPWLRLNGLGEQLVAQHLEGAGVFLSLGKREGLGLPPLEAMACGCLVAGYTGLGGREYATADNGFWVEEDDTFAAADALGHALHTLLTDPRRSAAMRQAGYATADRYSFDGMRDDLRAFWNRMLAA